MDQDSSDHPGMTICGAVIAFIALFFPLLTVTYAPPGGSGTVYGKKMYAFVDSISGWQFANTAAYFKLLPSIAILFATVGLSIIASIFSPDTAEHITNWLGQISHPIEIASDALRAFVYILISLGWLVVLLFAAVFGSVDMPRNGEAGILPAFQIPPFSVAAQAAPPTSPTPYLSASLGLGFYLLALGLIIGGLAIFKKVVAVAVGTGIILLLLFFIERSWCLDILYGLGL
jgi:vacuolar-type H+-ATPase subunit I/STV1